MSEYLKYHLSPLTQVLAIWGLVHGGDFVWIGLAWLPLLALIDSFLPDDLQARKMRSKAWAYVPVWISALLGPAMYVALAWALSRNEFSNVQVLGAVLSTSWLSVLPLVPASHELYHARGRFGKFVGRYVQICFLDPTRMEGHVVGHHIEVCTADDSDTALRGQSLYGFTPRAVVRSTILCQRILSDALEKKGFGRWSIRHPLWRAILSQIIFQALMYWIGGWAAVGAALAAMLLARMWVESFNYFQHYGQVRVVGAPIEKRHVWNHFKPLSRMAAFEITNHADHHLNSYQAYYQLVPHKESIRMPSVFVCFFAALLPPLWFSAVIKPALKRWDLEFANAEERQLAAEQNRRAGWEDWFPATGTPQRVGATPA
jgi:alkane 1-monooxygenase/p-cymene monooxygenase